MYKISTNNKIEFKYKKNRPFEQRLKESTLIRQKYPERIPIIVEKASSSNAPDIDKTKFLTPTDLTISQFVYVIRKRIKLREQEAIFLFINESIPCTSDYLGKVYDENKDEDGFLYINYSSENVFG
jgi:GABA(A) receptor-associated protein